MINNQTIDDMPKRYRVSIGNWGSSRRESVYLCSDIDKMNEGLFKSVSALRALLDGQDRRDSVQRFWSFNAQNIRCVRESDYDALEQRLTNAEAGLKWESERNALLLAELQGLQPAWPPRPPDGAGLPRYGLRWNGPSQPLAVLIADGYWTPWHLADQLRTENLELQRADECWSAVVSYMTGAGRMENPMEFLHCWNEGNFEAIRKEWPDAPKEVFYADPLSSGEAS